MIKSLILLTFGIVLCSLGDEQNKLKSIFYSSPIQTDTSRQKRGSFKANNGSVNGSTDEQTALALINEFRKVHEAPAMTLNEEMSRSAAAFAAKLAQLGSLRHSSDDERNGNGEALSFLCLTPYTQPTPTVAVTRWYNGVCNPEFTFGSEYALPYGGYFTQLVWKGSVELGFGRADVQYNRLNCSYYVARFQPGGNLIGDVVANVAKGSFDKNAYCKKVLAEWHKT